MFPISGLQRLFHAPPSSQSPQETRSLESLTEESHTYDLLYPKQEALLQPQHNIRTFSQLDPTSIAAAAHIYDDRNDLDIDSSRDVRVIIAQDGNSIAQQPLVLYDSHPPAPRPSSGTASGAGGGKRDMLQGSVKQSNTNEIGSSKNLDALTGSEAGIEPQHSPRRSDHAHQSAFWRNGAVRTKTIGLMNQKDTSLSGSAGEGREETEALLGCMFGHTGLPMVSSTKLHINPPSSISHQAGNVSTGLPDTYRAFPKRRTPLTRSMTAEDLQSPNTALKETLHSALPVRGPSVLVTRLFSVGLEESMISRAATATDPTESPQNSAAASSNGIAKQIKIPKYGVAISIQLPSTKQFNISSARLPQRSRLGSSYEQPAPRMDLWNQESNLPASNDVNDSILESDIERVLAHWSTLTRVISRLEIVARSVISTQLSSILELGLNFPVHLQENRDVSKAHGRPRKFKQPSRHTVQLPALALQGSVPITALVTRSCQRIVSALKTRRVVTGQGRWGVWREEVRWVGRWAGAKEQNFFLFNLFTAFLGNHMQWLDALHRGFSELRKAGKAQRDTDIIRHRTVIVSADKMAARRLIFLLSAFLPASSGVPQVESLSHPFSPASITGLSQSPPMGIPIPRERSLRRAINMKTRTDRNVSPMPQHERSISFTKQAPPSNGNSDATPTNFVARHGRRVSDTRSIRSLGLPIPANRSERRMSSVTTVSALAPDCVAVPHFASPPATTTGTAAVPRPGSSGSLASLSLQRTLSRSESMGESLSPGSPSASRWGSMLSGFWSVRRGSSTEHTDPIGSPDEGLGISGMQYSSNPGKLATMVKELDMQGSIPANDDQVVPNEPFRPGTTSTADLSDQTAVTAARDIPERPKAEEFPVKLSVDANDGVIDIDMLGTNSYASSFNSSISSPKAPNTAASSFNDHLSTYGQPNRSRSPVQPRTETTADVAGYLQSFHEDLVLQAVRPYKALKKEIKASMSTETSSDEACTTLIADTTNFSITRLTLRPLPDKPLQSSEFATGVDAGRDVMEEPLMDLDPTLTSAIERVIGDGQSGPFSTAPSRAPSPSRPTGHLTPKYRNEWQSIVMKALEKVVKDVSVENHEQKPARSDSTLREGVRRWLDEAER